jgi:hypothetical protein
MEDEEEGDVRTATSRHLSYSLDLTPALLAKESASASVHVTAPATTPLPATDKYAPPPEPV